MARPHNLSSPLTPPQVVAIREQFAAGRKAPALARQYGISESTVSCIVNGKRWAHVGGPIKTHGRPGRRPNQRVGTVENRD